MAKIYNDFQPINLVSFAKSFARLNGQPLDKSEIWYSLAEAQAYAATEAAYVGQILAVIDTENNKVVFYGVQDTLGTLKEVGSTPVGDELSVEIVDGVIQLKGFGTQYYAYVPAVKNPETGEIIEPSKYVLKDGFKAGLEPRVVSNEDKLVLAWYEPGTETVEDVAANIESVSKTVDSLDQTLNGEGGLVDQVDELKTQVGTAADEAGSGATGLYAEIERIDGELANKPNAVDVTKQIAEAVAGADHLKREIVSALPSIDDADPNTIYMVPTGLQEDDNKYHEWILINDVFEPVGSWEVDLSDYAKTSDLTNLTTTVTNLNQTVIDNKAETDKAIQDLNDAVNILETEVDTKVDKVYYTVPALDENGDPILDDEGSPTTKQVEGTLLSPEDKEKLAALVIDEDGSVEISGTINVSNVEGLGTWITENGLTYIKDLTEDNLSADLKDKINAPDFITSIDENNFTVIDGKLDFKSIQVSEVNGLTPLLDNKVDKEEGSRLINASEIALLQRVEEGEFDNLFSSVNPEVFLITDEQLNLIAIPSDLLLPTVGDITLLPHYSDENSVTLVEEINNIYEILAWQSMDELAELNKI